MVKYLPKKENETTRTFRGIRQEMTAEDVMRGCECDTKQKDDFAYIVMYFLNFLIVAGAEIPHAFVVVWF